MKRMSRFQQEISGQLGDYWQKSAEKELEDLRTDILIMNITIDEYGVARNRIGKAVMSDMLEKLLYLKEAHQLGISEEATKVARDKEVEESIAEYKRNYKGPSEEDLFEMRAAFGAGNKVVDVITGYEIQL